MRPTAARAKCRANREKGSESVSAEEDVSDGAVKSDERRRDREEMKDREAEE